MSDQILTVGRIVHLRNERSECRPALVTHVPMPGPNPSGICVTAFLAPGDDHPERHSGETYHPGIAMLIGIEREAMAPTGPVGWEAWELWHWPERV